MWWDLLVKDSFELFKEIYKIPDKVYRENIKVFSDILDLAAIENRPVRQLSLGHKEKGTTFLVTSNDMADIVNVCNDLIVIDHGNIVFKGAMNEVADIIKEIYGE